MVEEEWMGREKFWRLVRVSAERIWMVGTVEREERAGEVEVKRRREVGRGGRMERMKGWAKTV